MATDLNDPHQGETFLAYGAGRESHRVKDAADLDTWALQIQAADSYRDLIAADSTTGEGDPIVVVGRRPPTDTDVDGGGLGGDGDTGGAGTGGGGGAGGGGTGQNTDFQVTNDDAACENGAALKAGDKIESFISSLRRDERV